MARLSVSRAWDESRALFAHDGRLIAAVALALVGLPSLISSLVSPRGMAPGGPRHFGTDLVLFLVMVVILTGQIALVRLALKPPITVGGAIGQSLRRMPAYVGAAFLFALGVVIVLLPIAYGARAGGFPIDGGANDMSPGGSILVIVLCVLFLVLAMRMILSLAIASAEHGGPIHIIARSWQLTKGESWRLFAFVLALVLSAFVVLTAVSMVLGSLIVVTLGPITPMSLSALAVGLIQALFSAAFTAIFSVMLARFYAQLSGRDSVDAPIAADGPVD